MLLVILAFCKLVGIEMCEMKCLHKAANKTRRDKIRNEDIRKTVGVSPIMDYVNKQRVKWFGHLMRLPTEQPALRAYRAGSSGTRAKGRPRKRWIDDMKAVFKNS